MSSLKKGLKQPVLTSRDVYYFVAKDEGDCVREAKKLEQKTSHYHDNEQVYTEPSNDILEYADDSSFEDERDCELQSVMTYHSDAVDDYRLHSTVDSEEIRANEENAELLMLVLNGTKDLTNFKHLLLTDQENTVDIKETEIKRQNHNEKSSDCLSEIPEQRDINKSRHITDKYKVVGNKLQQQDDLSEERKQDLGLQEEVVFQPERENPVFVYKYQDERISNDSVQRRARIKSSRKGLPPRKTFVLLTTKGDPKKKEKQKEMEKAVREILMRGENKIKELRVRAQNLRLESEELRDENRALKKLQRLQGKQVADMERVVHMTTTTARDIKKDVRDAEVSSFSIDTSLRRKNKEIRQLRRQCERYEKLIDMDQKMPGVAELEERLDRAEKCLQDKDKQIETLNKKVKIQEKKRIKVRQKEQKQFAQLEGEVNVTLQECDELKKRLKDAERKINKTNIYSRKSAIHNALPAPPTLPALPWHPPVSRQATSTKVKKWLNDSNNKY